MKTQYFEASCSIEHVIAALNGAAIVRVERCSADASIVKIVSA